MPSNLHIDLSNFSLKYPAASLIGNSFRQSVISFGIPHSASCLISLNI